MLCHCCVIVLCLVVVKHSVLCFTFLSIYTKLKKKKTWQSALVTHWCVLFPVLCIYAVWHWLSSFNRKLIMRFVNSKFKQKELIFLFSLYHCCINSMQLKNLISVCKTCSSMENNYSLWPFLSNIITGLWLIYHSYAAPILIPPNVKKLSWTRLRHYTDLLNLYEHNTICQCYILTHNHKICPLWNVLC